MGASSNLLMMGESGGKSRVSLSRTLRANRKQMVYVGCDIESEPACWKEFGSKGPSGLVICKIWIEI